MEKKFVLLAAISIIVFIAVLVATFYYGLAVNQPTVERTTNNPTEFARDDSPKRVAEDSCVHKTHTYIVRGDSLSGIVEPGEDISVLFGFYDCNPVARRDVIAYRFSGNENPIIKIIAAVPGDSFRLVPVGEIWHISVNGTVLKTTNDEPYQISRSNYRRLSLYERDYGAELPEDTYMLLGNLPTETVDSRVFGLVHKEDIIGRVAVD